jgi:STE24 endopeptidase
VSRLILLLIFAVWFVGSGIQSPAGGFPPRPTAQNLALFWSGYVALVAGIWLWATLLTRELDYDQLHRGINRFNKVITAARVFIPLWLGVGVFAAGWGRFVEGLFGKVGYIQIGREAAQVQLPSLLLGTLPAILAWMGLWWAQFPADRAFREQTLLDTIEQDLPLHAPPTFWQYFSANFRQQLLFIFLPVLLIILVRDLALILIKVTHFPITSLGDFETWIMLPSAGVVYLYAPELLRRVLNTQRLEDSPLRERLEMICARRGLKYRDILIWQTQYSMGNAAVMGIIPRWRYILLSDLLLERMKDNEIEAVFAHELGHIVHRHMVWYIVFFVILILATKVFDDWSVAWMKNHPIWPRQLPYIQAGVSLIGMAVAVFGIFGYLSRRFERQADVFAARMMQTNWGLNPSPASTTYVGEEGAAVFASALRRVARINNIPEEARSWCHGSIGKRMRYLFELSRDSSLTGQFDRVMSRLYVTLILALMVSGAIVMMGGLR